MAEEQLVIDLNFTNDDETVTGDGLQSFLTTLAIGMLVKKDALGEPIYYISSVTDDNSFELTGKYQGVTETVPSVIQRSFTVNYNLPRPMAGDHGWGDMMSLVVDTLDNAVFSGGGWLTPFTQDDGSYMATDKVKARDSDGLALVDDGDTYGIRVLDGGSVVIGTGSKVGSRILEIRENSNYLSIGHDGSDALFSTDDGTFIFATAESLTNTKLNIKALAGMSSYLLMGETGGSDLTVLKSDLSTVLEILPDAEFPINIFENSSSGETRQVNIKGYRTGDAKRALEIGVGVDAADMASFDGVSKYYFDGAIFSGIIAGSGKLDISHNGTSHDLVVNSTTGYLGLGGVVDPTYPVEILNDGSIAQLGLRDSDGSTGNFATFKQATATLTIDTRTTTGNVANMILGTEGAVGIFIDEDQYVGVNNSNPLVEFDVTGDAAVSGDLAVGGEIFGSSLLISRSTSAYDVDMLITNGKIRISSSAVDDTSKYLFLLEQHYDIEEQDHCALYGTSMSDNVAQLSIGGGNPGHNAYSYVGIYAAEDSVTLAGSLCASFNVNYATFNSLITLPVLGTNGARGVGTNSLYSGDAALSAYDAVYPASDGYLKKAKADAAATIPCIGFVKTGVGTFDPVDLVQFGYIKNSAWSFTPGGLVYLSPATAGAITQTIPTSGFVQILGVATSADTIFVSCNLMNIEL